MDKLDTIIRREPIEAYQAQAAHYLTSHQLADFRKCPLLYHKKKLGLIEEEDRPAFLIGRALHTRVLEGTAAYEAQYAIGGPINPKTGEVFGATTKAFAEWAAQQGKPVLTTQQHELVLRMAEAIRGHKIAMKLLSDGIPEGVVREMYCGMLCQIRMDWFGLQRRIVDLKTCDDLDWFEADAKRYGYIHQMAFYRDVLSQAITLQVPVHFIVVEKREPFRVGCWIVSSDALSLAQQENEAAIGQLKQCIDRNKWPTLFEGLRVFNMT